MAAGTPHPVVVVINPSPVVIRRPAPGFISDPGPTVWRTPRPISVTIRSPVVVVIDDRRMRLPDPAVIARIDPIAVCVEVFGAPDVTVVIAIVITQAFGEVSFAICDPVLP